MIVSKNLGLIIKWSSLIGLTPYYDRKTRTFKQKRIYTFISIIILITVFMHSNIGKVKLGFINHSHAFVLRFLPAVASFVNNALTIVWAMKRNVKMYQMIMSDFRGFDATIRSVYAIEIVKIRHVKLHFFQGHIYLVAIMGFDLYVSYVNDDVHTYHYFINDVVEYYMGYVIIFLQYYILKHIKKRFVALNGAIAYFDTSGEKIVSTLDKFQGYRVDSLLKLHQMACDLVDSFNWIFGWNILFAMLQIVFKFLSMINSLLRFHNTWRDIAVTVLWNVYVIAQGVVIATKCEQVANEGKKTITVAYKALHRFSNVEPVREKLFILAQQATARCPKFTAAGFFNVDFSMLFTFVNLITTYVIVIIQFSSNTNTN